MPVHTHKPIPHAVRGIFESPELAPEITVQELAEAINYCYELYNNPAAPVLYTNFWGMVIFRATKGKGWLTPDQRPHLKQWIVDNAYSLVSDDSPENYIELNRLLQYL